MKMNFSKPVNSIRWYAVGAGISALILLSPAIALLLLIAAEALVDLLLVGGIGAAFAIAAGATGWVLSRKYRRGALEVRAVKGGFGRIANV